MVILTTSYNCEKYILKCLESIKNQSFQNFTCYIIDDMSTDGSVSLIKEFISHNSKFVLIENTEKVFQCGNYDQIIRSKVINDDEICVEVDGDDWLPDTEVLEFIDKTYREEDVWMTCGTFEFQDGRKSGQISPSGYNLRNTHFNLSHLRTWKSFLWKKIDILDLKDSYGKYWDVAGDVAFMLPMYEMSFNGHFKFIDRVCYVYNDTNPINEYKVYNSRMWEVDKTVKMKPPYKPL